MQVVFCWFLFSDELLSPVVAVFHISNTDMREVRVHNVFSVAFTVHPSFDNFLRRFLAFRDVFSGSAVCDAEFLHHVKWRTVSRAVVIKVIVIFHILRFRAGNLAQFFIQSKRF